MRILKNGVKLVMIRAYRNPIIMENAGYKMAWITDLNTVCE